ncbi:hypothetical protein GCM10010359_38150 [Streptomyces morookaense]|nr:hypothetical protein GCM10010359_38150 [Streptomyces morookaense]
MHGHPAPPFAGMTRIRFVRSEAVQPPSQPGPSGLPRVLCEATLVRAADRPEGRPGARASRRIPACPATPGTHSRRTGRKPEYAQYEGFRPARREHAPDAAGPPSGRRREFDDRPWRAAPAVTLCQRSRHRVLRQMPSAALQ